MNNCQKVYAEVYVFSIGCLQKPPSIQKYAYFLIFSIYTCTWRISTIFFMSTRVLNHNKYVEIKQFSKVKIKQNNISTVILLIKFFVYQWNPRHLQGNRAVYIFVYIMTFVFDLISNQIFLCINHKNTL